MLERTRLTSVVRIADLEGRLHANDTPLGLISRCLHEKHIAWIAATEEQLFRLEATRRMLMRVEAVHVISWMWSADAPRIIHAADDARKVQATKVTALGIMLPIMRRRARRRGMVWAILCSWAVHALVAGTEVWSYLLLPPSPLSLFTRVTVRGPPPRHGVQFVSSLLAGHYFCRLYNNMRALFFRESSSSFAVQARAGMYVLVIV